MSSVLDHYRQPEYTGENRCPPCTVVNVALAVLFAGVVGFVFTPAAVPVLAVSLLAIYLRGYLVPGTPELTKRYLPEWILATFDKAERPAGGSTVASETGTRGATPSEEPADGAAGDRVDSGGGNIEGGRDPEDDGDTEDLVDPETLLVTAGIVEECESEDDLCLTAAFTTAWLDAVDRLRDDSDLRRETAASVFDREPIDIEVDSHDRRVAYANDDYLFTWVSEGAFVADLAAARGVAERADWDEVMPEQRVAILKALRSFVDVCPLCDGAVAMTEDSVESCCRSWDVLAVRCGDCGEHFLEIDPETVRETGDGDATDGSASSA